MNEPRVQFKGRVSQALFDEFTDKFPQYGANTWLVENAISALLDSVRNNPTLYQIITADLERRSEHNDESTGRSVEQ